MSKRWTTDWGQFKALFISPAPEDNNAEPSVPQREINRALVDYLTQEEMRDRSFPIPDFGMDDEEEAVFEAQKRSIFRDRGGK